MSKTFTYTKLTKRYYCGFSDEWEEEGVEFDYEVDDDDLMGEIANLVFDDYFGDFNYGGNSAINVIKSKLKRFIEENDLLEQLADNYEDTIKEIFEEKALEFYED